MRNLKKCILSTLSILALSTGILTLGSPSFAAEPGKNEIPAAGRDYRIALKEAKEQGNKDVVHGPAEKVSEEKDLLKGNENSPEEISEDEDTGHLTVKDVYGRSYPYGFRRPGPPPNPAKLMELRKGERRGYGSGRPGPGMRHGRPGPGMRQGRPGPGMGPGRGPRPGMRPPYGRGPGGPGRPDGPRLRPGSTIGPRDFRRAARNRDRARGRTPRGPMRWGGRHMGPPHRR